MKKVICYLFVFAIIITIPVMNFTGAFSVPVKGDSVDLSEGLALLENAEKGDVKAIEDAIRKAEKLRFQQYGGATKKQIENTLKGVKSGKITLRQVFSDVLIVGDSLMNGLEYYEILDPACLITQVSANLSHLEENLKKIVNKNPDTIIFHYGINMISIDKGDMNAFIKEYTALLTKIKKALPETRMIVSGLFPVDRSIATDKRFSYVASYNKALLAMTKKLKIEFMDSSSIFKDKDYYGGDGIHLSPSFYTDLWLPYIIKNKGVVG